jgi:hypothetical protein
LVSDGISRRSARSVSPYKTEQRGVSLHFTLQKIALNSKKTENHFLFAQESGPLDIKAKPFGRPQVVSPNFAALQPGRSPTTRFRP